MTLMQKRRALMGAKAEELPVFDPAVSYTENKELNRSSNTSPPYMVNRAGCCVTDFIYAGTSGDFLYYNPNDSLKSSGGYCGHILTFKNASASEAFQSYTNCKMNGTTGTTALSSNKKYVRLNLPMDKLADCYAYNTSSGQIFYAGKNTQYYGKTNIND